MAGRTQYYGLGYFDFRDRLDAAVSVRLEQERFLTIDRQIFGMYSLFGNGVVTGLGVAASVGSNAGATVSVSPGIAFVQGRAIYIEDAFQLPGLPSGSDVFIYLRTLPGFGPGVGSLFYSYVPSLPNAVRLARVSTGVNVIREVDNSQKQQISFRALILSEIAKHKHRGSPSKIDLLREVKNFLPGARIGELDAGQITTGQFSYERMPRLRHSDLNDSGTLSHAGLESLARSLQTGDRVLLGEVTAANQLQQNIAFRKSHPNHPDYSINTITYVPGTSSDAVIDYSASNAVFSPSTGCVAGRQQISGGLVDIKYNNKQKLSNFFSGSNIVVNDVVDGLGGISLTSNITEQTVIFEDSFEYGTTNGVSGFGFSLTPTDNTIKISADDAVQTDGLKSAKIRSGVRHKVVFRKDIASQNNWSEFDTLFFYIRCADESHPPVKFYLINDEGDEVATPEFIVLAANEVTSNSDPTLDNFKLIEYDLTPSSRANVVAMVFAVDDASIDFTFHIDDVKTSTSASQQTVYSQTGIARYRYAAGTSFILNTIFWDDTQIPSGSAIEVRYRYGDTIAEINSSFFEGPISPTGQLINVNAAIIDIEITLKSNAERTITPKLSSFQIQLRVAGSEATFEFKNRPAWENCFLTNAEVFDTSPTAASVKIKTPLEVGMLYYSNDDSVQQVDEAFISNFGYLGADLPISPPQASRPATVWLENGIVGIGFDQASSVSKLPDKSFLISDTYNNRVVQIGRNGKFLRGVGNAQPLGTGGQFIPLCAVVNPMTRLFQVCFSEPVAVDAENLDLSKIEFTLGSTRLRLNDLDDVVQNRRPPHVLQIRLSQDKINLIENAISQSTLVYVRVDPSVLDRDGYTSSVLFTANYGLNGLKVFVGDFTYTDDVYHPVSAEEVDDKWLICNSSVTFDRIRAGLRPDTDEYFLNAGGETADERNIEFNMVYRFPNDNNIAPNGLPYKVTFLPGVESWGLEGTPAFNGSITFTQTGSYVAKVNIQQNANVDLAKTLVGTTYLLRMTVKIEIENPGPPVTYQEADFSPQVLSLRVTVIDAPVDEISDPTYPSKSVIMLKKSDWSLSFSYGSQSTFAVSDFTLGSAIKYDDGRLLISGLDFATGSAPPINDAEVNLFVGQALTKLANYRGKVIVVNTADGTREFQYSCPDGLYASDASVAEDGNILIAESAVGSAAGRITKVDTFGQIVALLSNGSFGIIHDVRETSRDTNLIST